MPTTFFRDPYTLLKYNVITVLVYTALVTLLLASGWRHLPPHMWVWAPFVLMMGQMFFGVSLVSIAGIAIYAACYYPLHFGPWQVAQIAAGLVIGLVSSTSMHNAVHGNFRPMWLNAIIGEICGLQQLLGYEEWKVAHIIHHQHPDNPTYDPHPPLNLPFWKFLLLMKLNMAKKFEQYYMQQWGRGEEAKRNWGLTGLFLLINLRGLFLFLLLGAPAFIFFFLPSFIMTNVFYAHFNYFTHRPGDEKGSFIILNLNSTWRYKLLNVLTWGSYFHKNHHVNPRLFNPRNLKANKVVFAPPELAFARKAS